MIFLHYYTTPYSHQKCKALHKIAVNPRQYNYVLCLSFFKWIKQHLQIKSFYGTSENAVKTQIWIAVSVYVLVAIIKKRLKIETSLYNILQVLSLTLFEKISLIQLLDKSNNNPMLIEDSIQLNLFDNFLGH